MKTTLELPDDLVRQMKLRAVHERRKLKDVAAEAIRRGLAAEPVLPSPARRRVQLPLFTSPPEAVPVELTCEEVDRLLLTNEMKAVDEVAGR